jgi:hypothetical protein
VFEVCAGPDNGAELCTQAGEGPRVDFGLVAMGMSATGHIRVMNTGDRELVASGSILTMDPEIVFSPVPNTLGMFSVPPGGEQRFDLTYTAADYAFDSINVAFGTNSAVRMSAVVRIDGRAPRAVVNAIPGTANFTLSGGASHSQVTIKIANCGELPLVLSQPVRITNQTGPGNAFTLAGEPGTGATIPPGPCQSPNAVGMDFTLNFDPPAEGAYTAEITVDSNDMMTPSYVIEVNGDKRP